MLKRIIVVGLSSFLFGIPLITSAQSSCITLTSNLSYGSRSIDVASLQGFLISQHFLGVDNNTGYFGILTQIAVQSWQKKNGIVSSGTPAITGYGAVGPKTRSAITNACYGKPIANNLQCGSLTMGYGVECIVGFHTVLQYDTKGCETMPQCVPDAITSPTPTTQPNQPMDYGPATGEPVTNGPGIIGCSFNNTLITSGTSVTAYQNASVPSGSTCVSEVRLCTNGALSGSYAYPQCTVTPTYPIMPSPPQTLSVSGYDIYSAAPIIFNGNPRLYFGGWYTQSDLPNDSIFVADCPYGAGACSNVRKVLSPSSAGLYQINDPTIVTMPGGYYIMYMTGDSTTTLASNNIYYSTSWTNDGINWSAPKLLRTGFWLPSATLKNGHVELYANSTSDGRIAKFDLGTSGVTPSDPSYVSFDNTSTFPSYYENVDVVWRPTLNIYQMVAERLLQQAPNSSSVIDYLSSTDGVSWHLVYPSIIAPVLGQYRVGTPAQWPDTAAWVYFASTAQQDSMGFKISFAQWSPPTQ